MEKANVIIIAIAIIMIKVLFFVVAFIKPIPTATYYTSVVKTFLPIY